MDSGVVERARLQMSAINQPLERFLPAISLASLISPLP